MSAVDRVRRHALLAMAALAIVGGQAAIAGAPQDWRPFNLTTWRSMLVSGKPAVVVFTTTDCEYCPTAIAAIHDHLRRMPGRHPELRVVVLDGDEMTATLAGSRHYGLADARYTFNGPDMPLRHAVNPSWRGETPYVALLPVRRAPRFVTGQPSAADLAWLSGQP